MQHFLALAGRKLHLVAAIAFLVGGLLLIATWAGYLAPGSAGAAVPTPDTAAVFADIEAEAPAQPTAEATPDEQVIVYVSGAVRAPDVYRLPRAARIKDLVLAAGGLSADADAERINLAERVADGQHIHVPRVGEAVAPSDAAAPAGTGAGGEQLIDINTASAADLDGLPGIGQALAQRIIEYRTSNGAFKSPEDLRNVKGIGPALFEKIAPLITAGT